MNQQELLDFVRGTGLQIAAAVFVLGMVYRMLHLVLLGRRKNLAAPRGSEWGPGLRTVWHRSVHSCRPDRARQFHPLSPATFFIWDF